MSLIKCVECGKEISEMSNSCPNCGCPTINTIKAIKKVNLNENAQCNDIIEDYSCINCNNTEYVIANRPNGEKAIICQKCGYVEDIKTNDNLIHSCLNPQPQSIVPAQVQCPYCHSSNVQKISTTKKAASIIGFGILSNKIGKQWHCNNCKSDF